MSEHLRDKATALYSFLKEFAELRSTVVRTIDSYDEVLWLDEIPRERECYCAAWQAGRGESEMEAWIEVQKPKIFPAPRPPADLMPWLAQGEWTDSEVEMPRLREEIVLPPDDEGDVSRRLLLTDNPDIRSAWERYVEERWWPWREEDRRGQAVQRVYTNLFRVYQKQQRLGEQFEAVLGLGFLKWELTGGLIVERHLVTTGVSVQFDAKRGVITVGPGADGVKVLLEQDMLDPSERPPVEELRAVEGQLGEIGDAIWEPVRLDSALASWAHSASSLGSYDRAASRLTTPSRNPQVVFAPALILRRRSDRSFIRAFKEILEQLEAGGPVPAAVARFIDVAEASRQGDSGAREEAPSEATETYFPLEANDDQLRIVERLTGHQGVLVQGPPGTGKSHTIVNLICHLLASGQRVLVTSHTARALQVLKGYIEKRVAEIAPLAVLLLGEGTDALQAMEDSVQGITQKQNHWDDRKASLEIAASEKSLAAAREEEAQILKELRSVREQETFRHDSVLGGYRGSLSDIGARLRAEVELHGWIEDTISEDAGPPVSNEDFRELLRLARRADLRELDLNPRYVPDLDQLPTLAELDGLIRRERTARQTVDDSIRGHTHKDHASLVTASPATVSELQRGVSHLLSTVESLSRHLQSSWVKGATLEILGGQDRVWRELHDATVGHAKTLKSRAEWIDQHPLTGIDGRHLRAVKGDSEELLNHLGQGHGLGWGPFRAAVVKKGSYILEGVSVGGRPCRSIDSLKDLVERLFFEERLELLHSTWAPYRVLRGGTVAAQVAEVEDLCKPLAVAIGLTDQVAALRILLSGIPGVTDPAWHDIPSVRELANCINAVLAEQELRAVQTEAAALRSRISAHESNPHVSLGLERLLEAFDHRDPASYQAALRMLEEHQTMGADLAGRNALLKMIQRGAPLLAESLTADALGAFWDRRADTFDAGWNWARARRWLARLSDPNSEQQLQLRLSAVRERVRKRLAEIASGRAWQHCFRRMTEHERQHLVAWAKAVKAIGKGTGKYAPLHRANAREHLNECRSAIPAWVMPLYRVAETITPNAEVFDVVIVDEASQSGPEALLLAYLAKKLIVVGDDKQISPTHVGLNREDVIHLRSRHLGDLPHRDAYGLEQSFFDLAEIRYPGRIRLREHFRCMPEIIQFSNRLCYAAEPLIPLRQYGTSRLDPAVSARFIEGGYLKGVRASVVNPPEAEAVAEWLVEALHDPRYFGKTFGVISLLGDAQSSHIQQLLLQRVGPEEMEARQIVCGDAYAFQGDERDVMLLSLVSAVDSERKIGTLTSEADRRRFNVAASRARDQMVLFHSATLGDLSPKCFRYQFLEYCQKPKIGSSEAIGVSVDRVAQFAATADRRVVRPPDPFDSWFEVDVFLKIVARGFRVTPQHEMGGYWIDLLVESMRGRIAVECDGDFWHGPERYELDAVRQRNLERCGLTFCRIRGSAFSVDPDAAMESVWSALSSLDARGGREKPAVPVTPGPPVSDTPGTGTNSAWADAHPRPQRQPNLSGVAIDLLDESEFEPTVRPRAGSQTPYAEWPLRPLPDPTEARPDDVVAGLVSIVEHEGPMTVHRACRLFVKACGGQRIGRLYRTSLHRALHRAEQLRLIVTSNEIHSRDFDEHVVRLVGGPAAIVRSRGPRDLTEVPSSEIAALMDQLLVSDPALSGGDLYRQVLDFYETRRMTDGIAARLRWVDEHRVALLGARAAGAGDTSGPA